jgi:hypothetical protein
MCRTDNGNSKNGNKGNMTEKRREGKQTVLYAALT